MVNVEISIGIPGSENGGTVPCKSRSYFAGIFSYIGQRFTPSIMVGTSNESVPESWPLKI